MSDSESAVGHSSDKYRCPNCERGTIVKRERIPNREFENDPSHIATHRCESCSHSFDPRSDSYIKWASGWYGRTGADSA